MPVNFTIQVTKEIIDQCKNIGVASDRNITGRICPIAVAVKHLFLGVYVSDYFIYPFGNESEENPNLKIPLPKIAYDFVRVFDSYSLIPRLRKIIPAFEFDIEISDEMIDKIDIQELNVISPNKMKPISPAQLMFR